MATSQLPSAAYVIGGQPTVSGWKLPDAQYGFDEDAETKTTAAGQFQTDIVYSRRQTLRVTLEALTGGTLTTYAKGGQISSGVFADGGGIATAWKIRSASMRKTRGPVQVELDLISLTDDLA